MNENTTSIRIPTIITVSRIKLVGPDCGPWKVEGPITSVRVRAYLEQGKQVADGREWYLEVAESMPTAATFVLQSEEQAQSLAARGYDAAEYGGYHADVIAHAEANGLIVAE